MDDTNIQSIEVEGIGIIKIRRRRGQKSTTLRLAKNGGIVLSTNYSTPLYSLKKFVLENRAWLDEVRAKNGLFDKIEIRFIIPINVQITIFFCIYRNSEISFNYLSI